MDFMSILTVPDKNLKDTVSQNQPHLIFQDFS